VRASYEATRHLIELGRRRIGYIGDRNGHQSDAERLAGYRRAIKEHRLPQPRELVVHEDGKPEGGYEAMGRLLDLPQPPAAVFCYNDMSALGAIRRIRDAGLRVPGDVSIVGFDDLFFSRYIEPPLTTIRQPMRLMGRMAMETLIVLMGGRRAAHSRKVPGELIVRASTAPRKDKP
jgi:DNA-binding LacI/PurR family transcriptional regulator